MGIRIPLENGVMVISWLGVVVLAAIPLTLAAIIYVLVSLRRKRRQKD
jgi:hypothetical protein